MTAWARLVGTLTDTWDIAEHVREADVVILDVHLPGPGLRTTVRAIRDVRPTARIVVTTAAPGDDVAAVVGHDPATTLVPKGDVDALLAALERP
jgi:DNA-binding NarL/FixJ family response regulator